MSGESRDNLTSPEVRGKFRDLEFGAIVENIVGGGTPSRAIQRFWGGKYPWVTVKDLTSFNSTSSQEYISSEGLASSSTHLVRRGTLILCTRMSVGKAVIFDVDVCINQDLKAVTFKSDVSTKFMYYWFEKEAPAIASVSGGSTVAGLSLRDLNRFRIRVPTLREQAAIAESLTDVDALLNSLDALIAKKRDIKQGVMQQLLTGKTRLPVQGVTGVTTGSVESKNNVPPEWSQVKVASVMQRVKNLPPSVSTSDFLGQGVTPIVDQGKELVSGFTNDSRYQINCPPGGYLVFGDHTRVVKFVDFIFATGADGTQVLEPRIPLDVQFITYAIQSHEIPNTGYNRHYKYLAELEILLPEIEEQKVIAEVLSDMDDEIDALVVRREKTALIKTGMMQELLTGRTRLL